MSHSQSPLIAALALTLLAACGPPWTVIARSGPPSALAPVTEITLAADRSQMMISSDRMLEAELAARTPEERQALLDAIAGMESSFATGFAGQAGIPTLPAGAEPKPGEARITVRWTYLDPGKYAFIYKRDSQITARIVYTIGATVVDEIEITRSVGASRRQASIVERLNIGGDQIGRLAGKYLANARAGG
jgi:hypothetical protein